MFAITQYSLKKRIAAKKSSFPSGVDKRNPCRSSPLTITADSTGGLEIPQNQEDIAGVKVHLKEWPYPPFPVKHTHIHESAFQLEVGLLKFFFNHMQVSRGWVDWLTLNEPQAIQVDDFTIVAMVHYDSLNSDQKSATKHKLFDQLGGGSEYAQGIFQKALKISRSRLGFATAMACNTETFLESDNRIELLQLITNYLFTFFMLDDVLEKSNADERLIKMIRAIFFEQKDPREAPISPNVDLVLRMLHSTIVDLNEKVVHIYGKLKHSVYINFMKVYFEQVESVIEECRQKNAFLDEQEYPSDDIFNANRQLTIGYYPFIRIVDLLLGANNIYEDVQLCRAFDQIGCKRLHLVNGLLSFNVEINDPDIDANLTAQEYLKKNPTKSGAFSNEILIHSLNNDCKISESILDITSAFNSSGQSALELAMAILSDHSLDYANKEAVVMRAKFMLSESCDYHRFCGRYQVSGAVRIDLESYLLKGRYSVISATTIASFRNQLSQLKGVAIRNLENKSTPAGAISNRLKQYVNQLIGKSQERRQFSSSISFGDKIIHFERPEEAIIKPVDHSKEDDQLGLFIDDVKSGPVIIDKKVPDKKKVFFIHGEAGIGKSSIVKKVTDEKETFWFNSEHVNNASSEMELLGYDQSISDYSDFLSYFSIQIKAVIVDNVHEVDAVKFDLLQQLISLSQRYQFQLIFISRSDCPLSNDAIVPIQIQPLSLHNVLHAFPHLLFFCETPLLPLFINPFYLKIIVTSLNLNQPSLSCSTPSLFPELDIKDQLVSLSLEQGDLAQYPVSKKRNVMKKIANQIIIKKPLNLSMNEILLCKELKRHGILTQHGLVFSFAHDLYRDWSQQQLFLSDLDRLESELIDFDTFLEETSRLPFVERYIIMYFQNLLDQYDCLENSSFKKRYLATNTDRLRFVLTALNLIHGVSLQTNEHELPEDLLVENLKGVSNDVGQSAISTILLSFDKSDRNISQFFLMAFKRLFQDPLKLLSVEECQLLFSKLKVSETAMYPILNMSYSTENPYFDQLIADCELNKWVIRTSMTRKQLPHPQFFKHFLSECIDHYQGRHRSKSNLTELLQHFNDPKKYPHRPYVPPPFGKKYEQYDRYKLFIIVERLKAIFPGEWSDLLRLILKDSPHLLLKKNSLNETPLHLAVSQLDLDLVSSLLDVMRELGLNIAELDLQYETPLHNAAYNFKHLNNKSSLNEKETVIEIFNLILFNLGPHEDSLKNPLGMNAHFLRALWDSDYANGHSELLGQCRWGESVQFYAAALPTIDE